MSLEEEIGIEIELDQNVETIDDLDELLVGEVYFKKDVNYGFDPKSAPLQLGWASTASSVMTMLWILPLRWKN